MAPRWPQEGWVGLGWAALGCAGLGRAGTVPTSFAIWPLLLRWMNEKTFRDWWHFKVTFYGINGCHICPDYHIIIRDGKPYLKALRFRSNCLDFTTYMWTSPDHFTDKSDRDAD